MFAFSFIFNLLGAPSGQADQANPGSLSNPADGTESDKYNIQDWDIPQGSITPLTIKKTGMEIKSATKCHYILTLTP